MNARSRIEGEENGRGAVVHHMVVGQVIPIVSAVVLVFFILPALVPLAVRPGGERDLLLGVSQVVLGVGLLLLVSRGRSFAGEVAILLVAVGVYWGTHLLEIPHTIVALGIAGAAWVFAAYYLSQIDLGELAVGDMRPLEEMARFHYRAFALLVLIAFGASTELLYPWKGEADTAVYALLLVTLVGALVSYIHYRLTRLEINLRKAIARLDPEAKGKPSEDGGAMARGSVPPHEEAEEN